MIGDWSVCHLPRCTYHVFLSHCAEDRDRLIRPINDKLQNEHDLIPWFDEHHYPSGQGSFEALRESILKCRHVVPLVTAAFLAQGRGWNSVENAFASLLQENLRFSSLELCHVQLPLFFVPHDHVALRRSAWGPLIERGRFYPPGRCDGNAVDWAVVEILRFIQREERRGISLAEDLQDNPAVDSLLRAEPNLLRRVMCADP
jgi:hypothetical protein